MDERILPSVFLVLRLSRSSSVGCVTRGDVHHDCELNILWVGCISCKLGNATSLHTGGQRAEDARHFFRMGVGGWLCTRPHWDLGD